MLRVLVVCLSGLLQSKLAHSQAFASSPTEPYTLLIERCERVFPKVMQDPSDSGGFFFERIDNNNLACIFGTLSDRISSSVGFNDRLAEAQVLVVMSTGGLVDRWLDLGQIFLESKPILIVDRICASSCANYLTPAASEILAIKGSLIAWHGGPDSSLLVEDELNIGNTFERSEAFIDQAGVSKSIFHFTARGSSKADLEEIEQYTGKPIKVIHGYALSPQKLQDCFGYTNADNLWHPGGNLEVYLSGRALAPDLVFLESPNRECKSNVE